MLQLVETRADGGTRSVELMELGRPGNLHDIADLGLTLPEAKQLLTRVQQAVVAVQARDHATLRPDCGSGTSLTEGTANFLVNRRMAKSQQMRWSRRGADLLLQVRCTVYNGTLGTGFGQRFQAANHPHPPAAMAA